MEDFAYVGELGEMTDRVEILTVVGFQENFCLSCDPGKQCPSYIVVGMPNSGDMIQITEITALSYDVETDQVDYVVIDANIIITVEPWKLGAI